MSYPNRQEAADAILRFGKRLDERQMIAANDGNLSVRIGENAVLITPSGIPKGELRQEQLITVDLRGEPKSGAGVPSSETAMHLKIYRENPQVGGVCHAHPVFATALAAAGQSLEVPLLTENVIGLGPIPLAPYATPGTRDVPASIAPFLQSHKGALLANHGALAWGKDLAQAYYRLETIEHTAKIHIIARFLLGTPQELTAEQLAQLAPFIGRFD